MRLLFCLLLLPLLTGCTKWLDEKPQASLAVPGRVADVQALLDFHPRMNTFAPVLGELMSDNYYSSDAALAALSLPEERQLYLFAYDSVSFSRYPNAWAYSYDVVFVANTALEQLRAMDSAVRATPAWRQAYGSALFFRARGHYAVLQLWALPYPSGATSLPGIPLRLTANFNEISTRSGLPASYKQVEADLLEAVQFLPPTSDHPFRPSQCAAYGYLSRLYLSMREYGSCLQAATEALSRYSVLLNYNSVNTAAAFPFARFNAEVIHQLRAAMPGILIPGAYSIDTLLLRQYSTNDLRRRAYFRTSTDGSVTLKGSYEGNNNFFTGLATDELVLTRAECLVRIGRWAEGMQVLNTFLTTRFVTGSFVPLVAGDANEALALVLAERRKSLVGRDLRWTDLRRLNEEGAGIGVVRQAFGRRWQLMPRSKYWALPIPADVVKLSQVLQNEYD